MVPWIARGEEPVICLVVDFRHYRKDFRLQRRIDVPENRKYWHLSSEKRVLVIRARVRPLACFPSKLKKHESSALWRRREGKAAKKRRCPSPAKDRPIVLLPPMQWTSAARGPAPSSTAPVISTLVQDAPAAAPSAPSPGEVFHNCEDQSDMEFLVGPKEWRFPVHSFILNKKEATLQALMQEAAGGPPEGERAVFRLPNLQPNVFDQMLRFIYTRQVSLSSVKSALDLVQPSQTYQLQELTVQCLEYISKNLTPSIVLVVLSHLLQPCAGSNEPANRSLLESHDNDNLQNELVYRCFQVVDWHADVILQSDEFENLDHDLMLKIVKRDTLEASSEAIVFDAIMRWACRACKRQRKELTPANKSEVLGKALYFVRYLLMTPEEFVRGPMSQGVLSKEDKDAMLARITDKSSQVPLPDHWMGWKISVKRQTRGLLAVTSPTSDRLSSAANSPVSPVCPSNKSSVVERKKKSMSKKFLNGVGDLVICVIHMLD